MAAPFTAADHAISVALAHALHPAWDVIEAARRVLSIPSVDARAIDTALARVRRATWERPSRVGSRADRSLTLARALLEGHAATLTSRTGVAEYEISV